MTVRVLATLLVAFGLAYVGWRWTGTVAWHAWWIAVPLVVAETYSLGESVLFGLTMWNARRRPSPPPAREGLAVDVYIATYNEPLELVARTALAARDMTYPHETYVLDDGDRPEFARMAAALGVGYVTRGPEWDGRARFAKAGNVNNALFRTTGDFIAILDADQVPEPRFLDRVLGYFEDETIAFVQTPQQFWNVPDDDPLGSRAELFYGPIQQGKDGWGAAFFCGSNAVLRREALMALGLTRFSQEATGRLRTALRGARSRVQDLEGRLAVRAPSALPVAEEALAAIRRAEGRVRHGDVLGEVTYALRQEIHAATLAHPDIDLPEDVTAELDDVVEHVEVVRTDQALAIQPMETSTITEDMATAMHLHAMGWSSAYHHEVLVLGLAPDDVGTMLSQRHRWATGSMQVFFSDNPLAVKGLTLAQRLMYLGTMTSYLAGFSALVYLAAPVVFLLTGVFPLVADPVAFALRFVPFFVCCQAMFLVAGAGSRGLWRGQQMSFALFPTWIAATLSGAAAVFLGRHVSFAVTSKTGTDGADGWRHVRTQVVLMVLLGLAAVIGVVRAAAGDASVTATAVTLVWIAVDLAMLWVVVGAARYRGFTGPDPTAPASSELDAALVLATADDGPAASRPLP
ncbi:cellulose synthase [Sediminihabitans luteus]|nr:cellulose synthase [Sediminihabitans luteus]